MSMTMTSTITQAETLPQHPQLYRLDTSTIPPESSMLSATQRGILIPTLPTFSLSHASGAQSSTTSRRRSNLRSGLSWNDSSDNIARESVHQVGFGSNNNNNKNSYAMFGLQGRSGGIRNASRVHPFASTRQGPTDVPKTNRSTVEILDGKSSDGFGKSLDSKWDDALRRIKIRTLTLTSARVPASASSRYRLGSDKFVPPLPPWNVPGSNPVDLYVSAAVSAPIVQGYIGYEEMLPPYDRAMTNEEKNVRFVIPATSTSPQQIQHIRIAENTTSKFLRNVLRQELSGEKPVSLLIEGEKWPFHVKTFFPMIQEGGEYLLEFAHISWAEEQMLDLQGIGRFFTNAGRLQQKHKVA